MSLSYRHLANHGLSWARYASKYLPLPEPFMVKTPEASIYDFDEDLFQERLEKNFKF